jgi:hypothetical protein
MPAGAVAITYRVGYACRALWIYRGAGAFFVPFMPRHVSDMTWPRSSRRTCATVFTTSATGVNHVPKVTLGVTLGEHIGEPHEVALRDGDGAGGVNQRLDAR